MRTCIFCGERAGSREHLWPKWILDMVRPRRIGGFIGLSTALEFEREFIVRSVCSACNSGWMSDLETANMPVMGPMIDDKSIALYENERGKIAGGWPRLLTCGHYQQVGAPFLRVFCEGREPEMPAPTKSIAHAASPPTLAKNARMGHLQWDGARKDRQKRATRPRLPEV